MRDLARRANAAYRRLPISWRLAGGSAALTGTILLGFAVIVGVLTTQRIQDDFNRQVAGAADELSRRLEYEFDPETRKVRPLTRISLKDYAGPQGAVIRVV